MTHNNTTDHAVNKPSGLLRLAIQTDTSLTDEEKRIMFEKAAIYSNLSHVLMDVTDSILCDLLYILSRYMKVNKQKAKMKFKNAALRVEQARKAFAEIRNKEDPESVSEIYVRDSSDMLREMICLVIDRVTNEKQQKAMMRVIRKQTNINHIFSELDENT